MDNVSINNYCFLVAQDFSKTKSFITNRSNDQHWMGKLKSATSPYKYFIPWLLKGTNFDHQVAPGSSPGREWALTPGAQTHSPLPLSPTFLSHFSLLYLMKAKMSKNKCWKTVFVRKMIALAQMLQISFVYIFRTSNLLQIYKIRSSICNSCKVACIKLWSKRYN